jgi:hypothetical protein
MVAKRPEHPLFVVAQKEANVTGRGRPQRGQPVEDALRVRAAIDVVAEEHQDVVLANLRQEAREEIVERRKITVDVADGDCRQCAAVPVSLGVGEYTSIWPGKGRR